MKIEIEPSLKIGDVFAERYEIKRVLGKGGQGEVYEVLDLQSNTSEVLKILTDIEGQNSFKKEIAALKALNNEGIVRIYDGDISSEKPYYTMEYLDGLPLNQLIANYSLSNQDIETIIVKLLQALKYLHETGKKLHRDIKPSNVFVVFKRKEENECFSEIEISRVVLIDFGTIRNINVADETLTKDSSVVRGTYKYMAPEQIDGKECVPATDIYAIGEILYEMVFKKPLYDSETLTGLISQKNSSADSLFTVNSKNSKTQKGGNSNFKKFILKATEPNPKNRFQSAEEAINFLRKPPIFYLTKKAKKNILILALFFIFLFLTYLIFTKNEKRRVESVNVQGSQISALDEENNVLWKKEFPAIIKSYQIVKNPTPKIEREIIVTTGLGKDLKRSGGIYLIKENGETLWEYEMGNCEWVEGCGNSYISILAYVLDIDKDGEKEYLFTSYNEPWFATLVLALKPNGEVFGYLWSCGIVHQIKPFEYKGKTHFAAVSSNNRLRTQTFFLFDASKPFVISTFGWGGGHNPFTERWISDPILPISKNTNYQNREESYPITAIFTPNFDFKKEFNVEYKNGEPIFSFKDRDGKTEKLGIGGYPLELELKQEEVEVTNTFLHKLDQLFEKKTNEDNKSVSKLLSYLENEIPNIPIFQAWFYKFSGMKFKEMGDLKKAERFFQKSIELFPEDKTPYVYLCEIYMLEDNIKNAEKCIDSFSLRSGIYITEYGSPPFAYPIYLSLLKEDFDSGCKILKLNLKTVIIDFNPYDITLNWQVSFFSGKEPLKEIPFYNEISAKDPSYWFWRIANEYLVQNVPLEVSVKKAPIEILKEEDFSQFLESLSDGVVSKELLSKIGERSNYDIDYRFYNQTCLLICSKYYENKGDRVEAEKYAKKTLQSHPIGFVKKCAQQIIRE